MLREQGQLIYLFFFNAVIKAVKLQNGSAGAEDYFCSIKT